MTKREKLRKVRELVALELRDRVADCPQYVYDNWPELKDVWEVYVNRLARRVAPPCEPQTET